MKLSRVFSQGLDYDYENIKDLSFLVLSRTIIKEFSPRWNCKKTKMKWILVDVANWYYHSKTSSVSLQTLSFAEFLNVSHLRGQSYLTNVYMFFL